MIAISKTRALIDKLGPVWKLVRVGKNRLNIQTKTDLSDLVWHYIGYIVEYGDDGIIIYTENDEILGTYLTLKIFIQTI